MTRNQIDYQLGKMNAETNRKLAAIKRDEYKLAASDSRYNRKMNEAQMGITIGSTIAAVVAMILI